jgi:phage gp46-like protein
MSLERATVRLTTADNLVVIQSDRKAMSSWIADHENLGLRLWCPRREEEIANCSRPAIK